MILRHPSMENLLLWDSGELPSRKSRRIKKHVLKCTVCQLRVIDLNSIWRAVDQAQVHQRQLALRSSMKPLAERPFMLHRPGLRTFVATAAICFAGFVFAAVAYFSPSVKADEALSRAVVEQSRDAGTRHFLTIRSGYLECPVNIRSAASQISDTTAPDQSCNTVAVSLHSLGWGWDDLLSAETFQRWRASLHQKHDSIRESREFTTLTTSTNEGPLREATIRLRASDYRPTFSRYIFFSQPPLEVDEENPLPTTQEAKAKRIVPAAFISPSHIEEKRLSSGETLREAEAQVLLALHNSHSDEMLTLAVDASKIPIKVRGIVPHKSDLERIQRALTGINDTRIAIVTGDDVPGASLQTNLKFVPFSGDGPALGQDQMIRSIGDSEARTALANNLMRLSYRLAGDVKAAEELGLLSDQIDSAAYKIRLRHAALEHQRVIAANLEAIAQSLQPVLGSIALTRDEISYTDACRLYTLIHEIVFMSKSQDNLSFDKASSEVRTLMSK